MKQTLFQILKAAALASILLGVCAPMASFAQSASSLVAAACGSASAKFDTHKLSDQKFLPPKPGTAVVYFISNVDFDSFMQFGCHVVDRGGIDGHWLGATCGSS